MFPMIIGWLGEKLRGFSGWWSFFDPTLESFWLRLVTQKSYLLVVRNGKLYDTKKVMNELMLKGKPCNFRKNQPHI